MYYLHVQGPILLEHTLHTLSRIGSYTYLNCTCILRVVRSTPGYYSIRINSYPRVKHRCAVLSYRSKHFTCCSASVRADSPTRTSLSLSTARPSRPHTVLRHGARRLGGAALRPY